MKVLKAGVISLTAQQDVPQNILQAQNMVAAAAEQGCDWVVLPEVFSYHGPYDQLHRVADERRGELYHQLAALARKHQVVLFAGSYAERPSQEPDPSCGQQRVYNTMYVFGRNGQELAKYEKTHLFNLKDESGTPLYNEGDGFLAGEGLVRFSCDGFEVGLAICYDLRFPGLFERLVADGTLDVLVVPAAFTRETGRAHWHLLTRTRAVDYQCYVLAANQVGTHSPGKHSYGHSLVVDPWGEVLADTGEMPGIAMAELSPQRLAEVRARLPVMANRRPELY